MRLTIAALLVMTLFWVELVSSKPAVSNYQYRSTVRFQEPDRHGIKGAPTTKESVVPHPLRNKGTDVEPRPPVDIPRPRKGEYNCGEHGERLCKLPPGVEPENCAGICQYPIA